MPLVHDYRLVWNLHQNHGLIQLRLVPNGPVIPLQIDSVEEFMLVAHMLTKAPVDYDPTNRLLVVPPRPAGS